MKVLLRNRTTRLYCAASNGWTAAADQAFEFTSVPQATRFALDQNLQGTEIILRYYTFPDEVSVPLLPEWGHLYQPDSAAA
jgi:hypothetical protein